MRELYARQLVESGAVPPQLPDELVKRAMTVLEQTYANLKPEEDYVPPIPEPPPSGAARRVQTAVPLERLTALNHDLLILPDGFTVHRKLERARERRAAMLQQPDERTVDWSAAEELAFASILEDRHPDPSHW